MQSEIQLYQNPNTEIQNNEERRQMSWQDDAMIEQEKADSIWYMGDAERRELEQY